MINVPHYDYLASFTNVRHYLEIGVQEGFSLKAVVEANPGLESVTLCDTWGPVDGGTNRGSHDHIDKMLKDLGYTGRVTYLDGPSQAMIPTLKQTVGKRFFDLIHVDGDHSYSGATADLNNVTLLACGALVVHDVFFPAVWQACSEWLQRNQSIFKHASINAEGTGSLTVTV